MIVQKVKGVRHVIVRVRFPQKSARRVGILVPDAIHVLPRTKPVDVVVKLQIDVGIGCGAKLAAINRGTVLSNNRETVL